MLEPLQAIFMIIGAITTWIGIGIFSFYILEWLIDEEVDNVYELIAAGVASPLILFMAIVLIIIQPFRFFISLKEDHDAIKKKLKIK